jgi:RNA polymerase sigma factor (sigma-70 family)
MALESYINEVCRKEKYAPMSAKQEKDIASRAKAGDEAARNEFIERNLRLVVTIANSYSRRYNLNEGEKEELVQAGNSRLGGLLDSFNLGYRFSTYAYKSLERRMQEEIMKSRQIRLPANVDAMRRKIYAVSMKYFSKHDIYPDNAKIANILGIDEEKIDEFQKAFSSTIVTSMNKRISADSEEEWGAFLSNNGEDSVTRGPIARDLRTKLSEQMACLKDAERHILTQRYFHQRGITEIANELGIPRDAVNQKRKVALRKMKRSLGKKEY